MSPAETLLTLSGLWLLAVLTPGPNMVLFSGIALSSSGRAAVASGAGIVVGVLAWGAAGLLGLFWLFQAFPGIGLTIKLIGAAYLIWMGLGLIRRNWRAEASDARIPGPAMSPMRAFTISLLTNLSNPKTFVFVTSLFAATKLAEAPLWVGMAGICIMMALNTLYYTLFGLMLTRTRLGARRGRLQRLTGIGIGLAMMLFGSKLALER